MNLNTFWKQPAKGFSEETRGRTEEEICIREEQIGFKFPHTYRELMKLQNGGYIRKSAFYRNGEYRELLYNGATIDKITPNPIGYQTMFDVLSEWKDENELKSLSPTEFNYLKRLPLISHMDGHEWMCFDYGWTEKEIKDEPEICFFNGEFKEYLRIKNFDEFINRVVYYGYESCEYYFGINTEKSIEAVAGIFENFLKIILEEKNDDKYGWFNFEKWYSADLPIKENLKFSLTLSPNKFINNTYLFQDKPSINYVIGIIPIKDKFEALPNNSNIYKQRMKVMLNKLEGIELLELLIPENVNE